MLDRRTFLRLLASVTSVPGCMAHAQAQRVYRVGVLFANEQNSSSAIYVAFRESMSALGYVEGRNLILDTRFGASTNERANGLAQELIALRPDVLVALTGRAVPAAARLSAMVPVVFVSSSDPVEAGMVTSLARPGRNVTGLSLLAIELVGKRIELLKELQPALRTVAVIADPQHPGQHRERAASEQAAEKLGIRVLYYPVHNAADINSSLIAAKAAGAEAAVVFPDSVTSPNRVAIGEFSLRNRLPVVAGWASFVEAGSVLSYGPNQQASFARAAYFVDRIIKGANPADLPIELPAVVQLAVNRKSAAALGLVIPQSILIRADTVIE